LFIFWLLFNLFALGMLVLDLRIVHRAGRVLSPREALTWSGLWIALAALFAGLLFFWQGRQPTLEFITGYVLELSLSVDNLFVFLVIFRFFVVPEEQQRGVLFWGIIGAMILRGLFIFAGVGLIHRFHWVLYVFGIFLILTGANFFRGKHEFDPQKNPVVNALRRWIPMTDSYQGGKFFVRDWRGQAGLYATPLLMVLAIIETTDVLFAVDSIPAVLAITLNAFIVYTSNVFAILGLRSMYFAVSELIKIFRFLHYGMATVLILIGLKMLASSRFTIPAHITLAVIAIVLVISIAASVLFPAERQS
jgi:tellurite resistance protein TerC